LSTAFALWAGASHQFLCRTIGALLRMAPLGQRAKEEEAFMSRESAADPSYWVLTKEPRYALVMVLPIVAIYQAGVVILTRLSEETSDVRNLADLFLRWVLNRFGLGGHVASGVLVIAVLVGWQLLRGRGWRIRLRPVAGMFLESLFYALMLLLSYRVVMVPLRQALLAAGQEGEGPAQQLILGLGAGVYEEFLFRLLLIGSLRYLLRLAKAGRISSAVVASVVAAVAFSMFHLVAEDFRPFVFMFRAFVGLVFAAFFFLLGFGITTATHSLFNAILVLLTRFGPP